MENFTKWQIYFRLEKEVLTLKLEKRRVENGRTQLLPNKGKVLYEIQEYNRSKVRNTKNLFKRTQQAEQHEN